MSLINIDMLFTNIHIFFTTWVVIIIIFHKYTHRVLDLLLLSFITMFCGLYFSIINPRKFCFILFGEYYVLEGADRFVIIDMFFHVLAFMFVYCTYREYYLPFTVNTRFIITLCLLIFYLLIIDASKLYIVSKENLLGISALSLLVYMLLFD